ncbi:unnamed protein product [Fraxinus pennsylvanica]|uniref:Uncharacterized protein n=1 Tax=Fraxinus pennsylvanica TaxID=56036 RepID=A0AAD1ZGU2_9LAMI|nr:unnamed protein product [Fraxinus pennsylvanica]
MGSVASPNISNSTAASSSAASSSARAGGAPTALSFNYPNMPTSETPYLAILQNNAYTFPHTCFMKLQDFLKSPRWKCCTRLVVEIMLEGLDMRKIEIVHFLHLPILS